MDAHLGLDQVEERLSGAYAEAILPDWDAEALDAAEADRLVSAFEAVRLTAAGRRTAPMSWLPASGQRVATALDSALGQAQEDDDWPSIRRLREAIVDLQAFLPDAEAGAAEAAVRQREETLPAGDPGSTALGRVRWSQAVVISMLRDDERVIGAHNALADIDIVIGQAQRSLEAVDRYKEAQMSGIAALAYWPAGLLGGLILGTLIAGLSVVAVTSVVLLGAAGWALALGPGFGWAVGSISSRIDRRAMRSDRLPVVRVGRWASTGVWLILFLGIPPAVGLVITIGCHQLGLP
jgi:hypothetical protein